jgi:hypothetical protein
LKIFTGFFRTSGEKKQHDHDKERNVFENESFFHFLLLKLFFFGGVTEDKNKSSDSLAPERVKSMEKDRSPDSQDQLTGRSLPGKYFRWIIAVFIP